MARSAARDVQLQSDEPSPLDEHPGIKQYFQEAHRDYQPLELEQESEAEAGRGSQMVEQDKPEPELKPDAELAADQDRESFNERWTAEQEAAREAYLERYEQQAQAGQDGRERDQDWENSL